MVMKIFNFLKEAVEDDLDLKIEIKDFKTKMEVRSLISDEIQKYYMYYTEGFITKYECDNIIETLEKMLVCTLNK